MKIHLQKRLPEAAALLSGLLLPLAFAPFAWRVFAWISPALLLLALLDTNHKYAAWRGYLFGLGCFGFGASWIHVSIHEFGNTGLPFAIFFTAFFVAFLSLFPAIAFGAFRWLFPKDTLITLCLGFPTFWVIAEWVRANFWTGFPWLLMGNTQIDTAFKNIIPSVGVYGVSWVLVLSAALLTTTLISFRKKSWKAGISLTAIFIALLLAPRLFPIHEPTESGENQSVALIQPNISQHLKWRRDFRVPTLKRYANMTEAHLGADLIIWPENAIPMFHDEALPFLDSVDGWMKTHESTLITGLPFKVSSLEYYNSIQALGNGSGLYHKHHLVPFGEFVPLESLIRGIVNFFDLPMSSFSQGDKDQAPLKLNGYSVAPFICYEIAYPEYVARLSKEAGVIVTISNDTWFGTSIGPHQHLEMAQMRAIETQRYVLRSTNNGISAIINPKGEITATAPQFEQATIVGEYQAIKGQTGYMRWGNWPVGVLVFVVVVIGLLGRKRG